MFEEYYYAAYRLSLLLAMIVLVIVGIVSVLIALCEYMKKEENLIKMLKTIRKTLIVIAMFLYFFNEYYRMINPMAKNINENGEVVEVDIAFRVISNIIISAVVTTFCVGIYSVIRKNFKRKSKTTNS